MKRLRQKHFRRYLLTREELRSAAHISELHPRITQLYRQWRMGQLGDVEVVSEYILNFLRVFRPRDYLGGPHNQNLFGPELRQQVFLHDEGDSLNELMGVPIFAKYSLRSVPLAVNRAIVGWAQKRYSLRLLDYIPSAEKLLKWQASGERIVTCLFKPTELTDWVSDSRDPLGFVLHDLIHADHFFRDPALCASQVEFYREVSEKMERGEYLRILSDAGRRAEFEYIVSDMNSHPAHLRACLLRLERTSGSVGI